MEIERWCRILGGAAARLCLPCFASLGATMVTLSLATLFLVVPAGAEIYKWTDSKGDLHFTDDRSKIPKKHRGSLLVDSDAGGGANEDVDYQKIVETIEKKQAEMPPGQVLSEQDVKALTEARKKLGR